MIRRVHYNRNRRWYVMFFPERQRQAALYDTCEILAARVGGVAAAAPHVTAVYLCGTASLREIMTCLRSLAGPPITIHAAELFAWSEQPHWRFGFTFSLHVRRDQALCCWQQAICEAVQPLALTPLRPLAEQEPHLQVVRHLAHPPRETLASLPDTTFPITFLAARLIVSEQVGKMFVTRLERELIDDKSRRA